MRTPIDHAKRSSVVLAMHSQHVLLPLSMNPCNSLSQIVLNLMIHSYTSVRSALS